MCTVHFIRIIVFFLFFCTLQDEVFLYLKFTHSYEIYVYTNNIQFFEHFEIIIHINLEPKFPNLQNLTTFYICVFNIYGALLKRSFCVWIKRARAHFVVIDVFKSLK
jgi:hypothetical protein